MNWFILIIISIGVLALSEIFQKITLTNKQNISAETNNTIVWIYQGIFSIIFIIIFGLSSPVSFTANDLPILIFQGLVYFFAGFGEP